MDVLIPNGTYILVIDTDAYSGNFEREMCGFVTGYYDMERCHGAAEADVFLTEEVGSRIPSKITQVPHNEYGMVSNTIRATPGRLNDGMGFHYDADDSNDAYPAYESVAIFFSDPLTPDEMEIVSRRAHRYAKEHTDFMLRSKPFAIRNIYQLCHNGHSEETIL